MTVGGVDPVLFGDQTLESSQVTSPSGSASAFPFSSQLTGDATSFDVYVDSGSSATKLVVGLYGDKRGRPGSLLASSSMILPSGGSWSPLTFNSTPVYAGRNYWIAILGTGGRLAYRAEANGPCTSAISSKSTLTALPSSWSTGSQSHSCPASLYVNGFEAPPWNTVLPAISGTAVQDQTLTVSPGSWGNAPTSFAYQWQHCGSSGCSNISGATGSTYVLQSSDVNDTTDVVVTATGDGGSASATSGQSGTVAPVGSSTGPPPVNTVLPAISGATTEGSTLTSSTGTWTNSPTSFAYQWQDCTSSACSDINGATSPSYTLQSSDVGNAVDVVVTATNSGGSASATSTQSAAVAVPPSGSPPANASAPTISGVPTVGNQLTASTGTWSGSPTLFTYQWQDCLEDPATNLWTDCAAISGATSSTYTVTSADSDASVHVVVTAHNTSGTGTASAITGPAPVFFNRLFYSGSTTLTGPANCGPAHNQTCTATDYADRYQWINPSSNFDSATLSSMEAANPHLKMTPYIDAIAASTSDPNHITTCMDYATVSSSHPSWLIRSANGAIASPWGNDYAADPANTGWQNACFAQAIANYKAKPWNGGQYWDDFTTNIGDYIGGDGYTAAASGLSSCTITANSATVYDTYPSGYPFTCWHEGLEAFAVQYSSYASTHGGPTAGVANIGLVGGATSPPSAAQANSFWTTVSKSVGGGMDQGFADGDAGFSNQDKYFAAHLSDELWSEASHKWFWAVPELTASERNEAGAVFGLGEELLAANGYSSYSTSLNSSCYGNDTSCNEYWYPDFDTALRLGPATGSLQVRTSGGATFFERDFTNGVVLVNPSSTPVTTSFAPAPGGTYTGNSCNGDAGSCSAASNASSLTLSTDGAAILLRTG